MKDRARPIEIIFILLSFVIAGFVLSVVYHAQHGDVFDVVLFNLTDTLPFHLRADSAGIIFAVVSSLLYIPVSFYSVGYIRRHEKNEKRLIPFYLCFSLCVLCAVCIAFSANLLTFFVFYEILTIATWPLVFHERTEEAIFSSRKYLIYTFIPGQLLLIGIIIIYMITGNLEFVPGGFISSTDASPSIIIIAFVFTFLAGAVKAGMMPFHGWLPSAMIAPTPVSALLHAVAVVKAGAFCIIRIIGYTFGPEILRELKLNTIIAVFACFTIICASLIALRQDNLKKRLAFSTVGQLSYIILGMCMLNTPGITGGLFHIAAHAVMKITLFMCAGAIMVTTHKTDVSQLHGLGRRMPITFFCFSLASLGIAGLPFIAGFISKWNLGLGALAADSPLYILVLIASAMLSLSYLMPVCYVAFLRGDANDSYDIKEAGNLMLVPICITAIFSVILGINPNAFLGLFDYATAAATAVMGGI